MPYSSFDKFDDSSYDAAQVLNGNPHSSVYEDVAVLIESADYKTALRFLDDALAFTPMDYHAWTLRGVALVFLGKYEEAIASCDRAIGYQPNHSEAWKFRGLALHALNRYREAHESYERALGIEPQSPMQRAFNWLRSKLGTPDSYDYQTLML
ncbi:MAG: tetratricopeptide repeat protein [Leptolyngbyaceae bacterium]|nr:tetratricopeptide repeat protein [Leptolyngbyaceae bacterium]